MIKQRSIVEWNITEKERDRVGAGGGGNNELQRMMGIKLLIIGMKRNQINQVGVGIQLRKKVNDWVKGEREVNVVGGKSKGMGSERHGKKAGG